MYMMYLICYVQGVISSLCDFLAMANSAEFAATAADPSYCMSSLADDSVMRLIPGKHTDDRGVWMVCTVLMYLDTPLAWQEFAQSGLAAFLQLFCSAAPHIVKFFADQTEFWTVDFASELTHCFNALGQASTPCFLHRIIHAVQPTCLADPTLANVASLYKSQGTVVIWVQ